MINHGVRLDYRGLTISVEFEAGEYAAIVYRPDGTDALTCYGATRDGAIQCAKDNIDINLRGPRPS